MSAKIRSTEGCWTCRLRRKKCDEGKPSCEACRALEIECLYGGAKPDWMDGGPLQKEKADALKAEVKRQASSRREKKYLQPAPTTEDHEMADDTVNDSIMSETPSANKQRPPDDPDTSPGTSQQTPASDASMSTGPPGPPAAMSGGWEYMGSFLSSEPVVRASTEHDTGTSLNAVSFEERELSMAMLYLDHAFPFLFPFYRPTLLDAGRGWLLVLLSKNKSLFHAALSLGSYFFALVMDQDDGSHEECKIYNAQEFHKQQDLALKELQAAMARLSRGECKDQLLETTRVMASIVQLMIFEVASGGAAQDWQIHLNAASELFGDVMNSPQLASTPPHHRWISVLNHLSYGVVPVQHSSRHPWTSDQSSMRFFTANLLLADVLASTALETAPKLQQWHTHLLTPNLTYGAEPYLRMEKFIGIDNVVVMSIGKIAALAAWKKEMKQTGSLSISQLVARAAAIEKELRARMFRVEHSVQEAMAALMAKSPATCLTEDFSNRSRIDASKPEIPVSVRVGTILWAQAALTYLNVVLSGWQPASPEIHDSVALAMDMFGRIGRPSYLSVLAWPFCVTGCLAGPDHEDFFRTTVRGMQGMHVFGTMQEALAIMERVWSNRATIERSPDSWDLAACLRSLGHASLLI